MIDPRNMPCARVCLSRLLPKELPPNAQEQYHNYTIQRKSSLTSLNAAKDTTAVDVSSISAVDFSCELGESDQSHTNATSVKLNVPMNASNSVDPNTQHLPNNSASGYSASTQSSLSNYSCMPAVNDQVELNPVNITTNMSAKRRSSETSVLSSHSSKSLEGREIVASISLTPVTWKTPRYTTRLDEDCMPENELVLSEMSDGSTLSGTECKNNSPYFTRRNLKPPDFSYEEVSVTSSTANASEQGMDENRNPSDYALFSDHVMYGCEDMWPDLHCYSPPESPDSQETESTLTEFYKETSVLEDLNTRTQTRTDSGKPGTFLSSLHCNKECFTDEQNSLCSPEVNQVLLDVNKYEHCKRKMSCNEISYKRKSISPKGELVVKVEDVREKLKPCASGGLTVVTNSSKVRYTSSGRRIANNYSEKELAKLSLVHAREAAKKKRKVRKKVPKGSTQVRKHPKKNLSEKRHNPLLRYKNLKFSELNTINRMSVRYKVAFTKWPFVFSGALDLINQRLVSQNVFWDSLRS